MGKGEAVDMKSATEHYEEAVRMLDTIREFAHEPEVVGDREMALHNLVLGPLLAAVRCDPDFLPALEMMVRVMTDEMGSYAEALEPATVLLKKDPNNRGYRELRDRILRLARECYPDMHFE
jgi:hypothetical protein